MTTARVRDGWLLRGTTLGLACALTLTLGLPGPAERSTARTDAVDAGLRPAAAGAATQRPDGRRREPTRFGVATFNLLGASHTTGRDGWPSGKARMRRTVKLLGWWHVGVAAFQEFQEPQFETFQRITGDTWSTWPRLTRGPRALENSVAWRRKHWRFESGRTVEIPYFDGNTRPMPVVRLRHRDTGRRIVVTSFHNPASNKKRGNNDRARNAALRRQGELAKRVHRRTGLPVFILGDLNDREKAFCRITRFGPLQAANGGRHRRGECRPPEPPLPVNWILATRDVDLTDYRRVASPRERRISDHFLVRATVTMEGRVGRLSKPSGRR